MRDRANLSPGSLRCKNFSGHGALRCGNAIILGCTEISLLVGPGDSPVPLFDITALHAVSAAEFALGLGA